MNARSELQEYQIDPYNYYETLRENRTFEPIDGVLPQVKWSRMVTRYDDVRTLLRDPRMGTDPTLSGGLINVKKTRLLPKGFRSFMNSILFNDGADHSRLRKLVSKAFKPSMVAALEGRVIEIVDHLLDEMEKKEVADFVEDFAIPLPLIVISEMMGVSEEQGDEFRKYSLALVDNMPNSYWDLAKQLKNYRDMQKFFDKLIQSKREHPGDDLTTALISAEEGGDKLDEMELVGMLLVVLAAGHETTVNLLAGGLLALLDNPAQLNKFKANQSLVEPMIEELLRYANPIQFTSRTAKENFEFNGNTIKKGESVLLFLASANRDGDKFENPDNLDIARSPNEHLAFGFGTHFCLGAQLSRLEAKIAFTRLFERYPDIQLAVPAAELKWRKSRLIRGLAELPVKLDRK